MRTHCRCGQPCAPGIPMCQKCDDMLVEGLSGIRDTLKASGERNARKGKK